MSELANPWIEGGAEEQGPKLIGITPLREDYARIPILKGFGIRELVRDAYEKPEIEYGQELFLFAFRSKTKDGLEPELLRALHEADAAALAEAKLSRDGIPSGILCYFAGKPDAEGWCMSLCLWTSFKDASRQFGPAHGDAMALAPLVYEERLPEWYHAKLIGPYGILQLEDLDPISLRQQIAAQYN